jgi:hypothetical protein
MKKNRKIEHCEEMKNLFLLSSQQREAFLRMKVAHADCLKLGIEFYNNYGLLGALDSRKFERDAYNDRPHGGIQNTMQNKDNEFDLECSEWCDDRHWFHPKPTLAKGGGE